MSRVDWAPLDAPLRQLAAQGLSSTEIAGALGVTRNAVFGRLKRLHIRLRKRVAPIPPRWPEVDPAGDHRLLGQCFGGARDRDPGDGGLCRASRSATELQTATVLGGEM